MVLFHDVVQLFPPDHFNWDRATKTIQHLVDGLEASSVSSSFVDYNLSRKAVDLQHTSKEFCVRGFVSTLRKHEIKRLAVLVDNSIEIDPVAFHLDVSFVHSPGAVARPFSMTRRFSDCACIPRHPALQRRVIYCNASLMYDLFQIAISHTVSDIDKHSEEDHIFRILRAFERDHKNKRSTSIFRYSITRSILERQQLKVCSRSLKMWIK